MDEAYIDNDELLSQARKVASELADMDADEEAIVLKVKSWQRCIILLHH